MIATGGEGEEGEKVNLKICLARELNPGLQRERPEMVLQWLFMVVIYEEHSFQIRVYLSSKS